MTFENVRLGRVFQAIAIILAVSFVFQIGISVCYMLVWLGDTVGDLDPNATEEEQNEAFREKFDQWLDEAMEGSGTLNAISIIGWTLMAGFTHIVAYRTARHWATSPEQAVGYGVMIGAGTMLFMGICVLGTPVSIAIKLLFLVLTLGAGALGGQLAGARGPRGAMQPSGGLPPGLGLTRGPANVPPGQNPQTYYNMGVSAALGSRRDEARQHFTRVVQMDPRHLQAWLQLANLADTPGQAWEYIHQARAIDPGNPAVVQAVDIIWPQVAADAGRSVPTAQPPYPGGAQDDVEIPRTTLPGGGPLPKETPSPDVDAVLPPDASALTPPVDSDDSPPDDADDSA
jgi:hypothetical protein